MDKHLLKDMGLGFLGTLVSLAVCLFVPKVVDLKGLFWFLLIPFCFYLTVMVIALLGKKKGSYGVPIGIMGFFLCWAAVALYQEQQATNFASRVENQSTPLKWEALPKAILTGNPVQPWSCKKDCTEALINGLPVFTRYYRGIHRISLGSGEKCWHPKAIRTKMLIGNYLPEDKCFIAEDVSEEVIHAVEFTEKKPEREEKNQTDLGEGYPKFTWSYVPWNVVLHQGESSKTIASGFTGNTQYPFWLPIPYLAFPQTSKFRFEQEGSYGIFGWSRLYASTTPIGQGLTNETFIRNLASTAGLIPLKRQPTIYLKAGETGVPQTAEERATIRKRLTMLVNSSDPDDREWVGSLIKRWGKAGGDLKDIRFLIEVLLRDALSYRRHSLYTELYEFGDSVPDWLATLLITIDPDWSNRDLGLALLKAAPHHAKVVEEAQMKQFVKDLDLRKGDSRNMIAIALLLPRFSDESLSQIYSNCRVSSLNEIWEMADRNERKRYDKNWKPLYTLEEKKHYAQHVGHCLKARPKKDPFRVRFEALFGELT